MEAGKEGAKTCLAVSYQSTTIEEGERERKSGGFSLG